MKVNPDIPIKVLVGCPTSSLKEYCLPEYLAAVQKLRYRPIEVVLVDTSDDMRYMQKLVDLGIPVIKGLSSGPIMERIVHARNLLREQALEKGCTWLLMLEQDVIPPPQVIERLMDHRRSIVSGVYFGRHPLVGRDLIPMAFKAVSEHTDRLPDLRVLTHEEVFLGARLQEVAMTGLGCLLLHRDVFEKIPFRLEKSKSFDDQWFFTDVWKAGIPAFVDTKVKCKHLLQGREFVWDFEEK